MSGCSASAEGTRRFAQCAIDEGNADSAYRALGRTGLVTSSLGFGSYRIDAQTPEHAAALEKALLFGISFSYKKRASAKRILRKTLRAGRVPSCERLRQVLLQIFGT